MSFLDRILLEQLTFESKQPPWLIPSANLPSREVCRAEMEGKRALLKRRKQDIVDVKEVSHPMVPYHFFVN